MSRDSMNAPYKRGVTGWNPVAPTNSALLNYILIRRFIWPAAGAAEHRRVVEAFASAAASGDLAALIRVLDPDVVLVSDGGGLVTSARRPVLGADRVGRFLLGILAREQPGDAINRVVVNGHWDSPSASKASSSRSSPYISVQDVGDRAVHRSVMRCPASGSPALIM